MSKVLSFANTRQMEGIVDELTSVKEYIESKVNLSQVVGSEKRYTFPINKVMRICFLVGLGLSGKRSIDDFKGIQLSKSSARIVPSFSKVYSFQSHLRA